MHRQIDKKEEEEREREHQARQSNHWAREQESSNVETEHSAEGDKIIARIRDNDQQILPIIVILPLYSCATIDLQIRVEIDCHGK